MTSPFGPGRLDSDWLLSQEGSPDPWVLETFCPHDPGHRDAFLGNGLIGQRIGVEGDAGWNPGPNESAYPRCLMHGLWDECRLMAPPRWALLSYHDGRALFAPDSGEWRQFRQKLDMRQGKLETEVFWLNDGQGSRIHSTFYLSRTQPNLGVLTRVIRPDFEGEVALADRIDASHVGDACDWRFQPADDPVASQGLELRMGPRLRRVAVVSRLQLEGIDSPTVECTREEKTLTRTVKFAVRPGQCYRITKFVALTTDHDSPTPGLYARVLVEAAAGRPESLERDHDAAWEDLWRHRIAVSHPRLEVLLNSCLYQFYSHLRPGSRHSLGPAGLSAKNWSGHVFWDSDLWMFPVVALLHPGLARGMVDYRFDTLEGARRNARAHGRDGAQFAWESAEFGDETIPDLIFHHQHHVNSDVALAQWWYWKISGDDDFYRTQAAPVLIESARFWASRVTWNKTLERYEILAVCCADELAGVRDNNAYTNYSAVRTLELASEACDRLGLEVPVLWRDIMAKMWIPFDEDAQRFVEYEGYVGETIKQADTALLIYPYGMPMTATAKANTVDYYRQKYPPGNIMMAAAFDGIVDCELGRPEKAWESLGRLLPHFRMPFLLASESPSNEIISFATGLGGLLQLVVMGFAGVRMQSDGLVVHPCLPPEIGRLQIVGMHYQGVCFDLSVEGHTVSVANASAPLPFRILDRCGREALNKR